ncbi:MAG: guanylate kinase [Gammaproteobacteria bacterium GWE2_42_36]|nr:MAG: guanylate kinase [Gammaproteobacteria bacterium GWE2_42_36]HCU04733.1 guanylate kinase [Coxiellaceae bacterium]
MRSPILYIISAASGTGKTSLIQALLQKDAQLKFSISHTTRKPREGEQDGIDYHFISIEQFEQMIKDDAFLEYANVFGNYYGTSKKQIENNHDVILEIDWQGADRIRYAQLHNPIVSIFVLPPSFAALKNRIMTRNKDHQEVIQKRLETAASEIRQAARYDYLIINDHFDTALQELQSIIQAERCKAKVQLPVWSQLMNELTREKERHEIF